MILDDTRKCVKEGRTPVILTKYKEQAKYLYDHLQKDADHVFLLYGDNSDKENLDVRRSLKEVSYKTQAGSRGIGNSYYNRAREYLLWQPGVSLGFDQ